jgi:hypothetical protein
MGGEGAVGLASLQLALFVDAAFFPLPAATRIQMEGQRDYVQTKGSYAMGPGILLAWPVCDAVSIAAGVGTCAIQGDGAWSGWTEAGLRFPVSDGCHIEAGWRYCPLPDVADHRVVLQFRFRPDLI